MRTLAWMIHADLASGDVCGYSGEERALDTVAGLQVTERRRQVNGALSAVL